MARRRQRSKCKLAPATASDLTRRGVIGARRIADPDGNQISSPRARFIQWRATVRASVQQAAPSWVEDVSVAYLPRNVAPEVLSITALPIGVGLQQIAQVAVDPNVESSGLDPSVFGPVAQVPPRRFYQRGARSFQWQAEDRNSDTLEYAIYYRALNEQTFRLLKDKLRDNFYTIDGATLADGRYIIKVVASDAPDNPPGQKLTGERLSEPVDIDNTPPVVKAMGQPQMTGDSVRVVFSVDDATGKVKKADASLDGAAWIRSFRMTASPIAATRSIQSISAPRSGRTHDLAAHL